MTIIYCNSQSAINLTKNQMHHERTKYINVKYHFIRDVITIRNVRIEKIKTHWNLTNTMIKNLAGKFKPTIRLKLCASPKQIYDERKGFRPLGRSLILTLICFGVQGWPVVWIKLGFNLREVSFY